MVILTFGGNFKCLRLLVSELQQNIKN